MSRFDLEPVPVTIGPCECSGTPHGDGDVVFLAPKLPMDAGMAAQAAFAGSGGSPAKAMGVLARVYQEMCVTGWNLLDDAGRPVPMTADALANVCVGEVGTLIAEKADELYSEDLIRPLVARRSSPLPIGSTTGSTSRSPSTRKRSGRS